MQNPRLWIHALVFAVACSAPDAPATDGGFDAAHRWDAGRDGAPATDAARDGAPASDGGDPDATLASDGGERLDRDAGTDASCAVPCGGSCCRLAERCLGGACVCAEGADDCGGACVLRGTVANCESTCHVCPTAEHGEAHCVHTNATSTRCELRCEHDRLLCDELCALCPEGSVGRACEGGTCAATSCELPRVRCGRLSDVPDTCEVAPEWTGETVDSDGVTGIGCAIAIDRTGLPVIAYASESASELRLARLTALGWSIETVATPDDVGPTSIAIDSRGYAHIAFHGDDRHLWYAAWDGTRWLTREIETRDLSTSPSLVLDSHDRPHIAYRAWSSDDLRYAHYDGSWTIETVDSAGDVGRWPSLALDSLGRPHIAYHDTTNQDLKYARRVGTVWTIETVASAGDVGEDTSLALSATDEPHIAYADRTRMQLRYATRGAGGWSDQPIDDGRLPHYTSIQLDPAGAPHIAYGRWGERTVSHAWWSGSCWSTQNVDFQHVATCTALAIDAGGGLHVVHDSEEGTDPADLRYLHD
jgi:hypothetical protein